MPEILADHQRTGTVSLTADGVATSTVKKHRGVAPNSHVNLQATNAAAATEVGAGGLYVVCAQHEFTIHHSASASARTFTYHWMPGPRI